MALSGVTGAVPTFAVYFGMFIYVIRQTEPPRSLKVGKSRNPERRLRSLQTGSPCPLELLYSVPGDGETEREFHAALSEYAESGEWFTKDALPRIKDLVKQQEAAQPCVCVVEQEDALILQMVPGSAVPGGAVGSAEGGSAEMQLVRETLRGFCVGGDRYTKNCRPIVLRLLREGRVPLPSMPSDTSQMSERFEEFHRKYPDKVFPLNKRLRSLFFQVESARQYVDLLRGREAELRQLADAGLIFLDPNPDGSFCATRIG